MQKLGQGKASDGVPCSNRLARDYVSKLRTAPAGVAREPLSGLGASWHPGNNDTRQGERILKGERLLSNRTGISRE